MDKANAVQTQLKALFEACRTNDLETAAQLLLYRGEVQEAHFTRAINPTSPEEKNYLEGMVSRINEWLVQDADPKLGEVLYLQQAQGEWVAQEVIFNDQSPDPVRRYFGFLFVEGAYRLGDIDR